jgi:peptidyl-tRNA hydrolase ICT1
MLTRIARGLARAHARARFASAIAPSPPPPPAPAPDETPPDAPRSRFVLVAEGDTRIELPRDKLTVTFSRSSGAGGQNVNKVSTKADVRFVLADAAWLAPGVRARVAALFPAAVTAAGDVVVTSQRHRTQEANLDDALDKLRSMIARAAVIPKVRATRTALSELTKAGYRDDKRARSAVKAGRRGPSFDE